MNQEFEFVQRLVKKAPRSKNQVNEFFKSDAEVLKIENGYLCASIDTIAEEISLGLVRDPVTLGWLAAQASFSDLAAVGVSPQHLSVTWVTPGTGNDPSPPLLRTGIELACASVKATLADFMILRGQQNLITSTAYGISTSGPLLSRGPIQHGDFAYLTGPLGYGNAVAFANVALRKSDPKMADSIDQNYRPHARIKEALFIRNFANSCLDTSDGGLFSFDLLSQLNKTGLEITYSSSLFHPLALQLASVARVNPFLFFAAQNGEFELLFTVPEEKNDVFLNQSRREGLQFLPVGRVTKEPDLVLHQRSGPVRVDMTPISDLLQQRASAQEYILALLSFASSNKIEV